MVDTAEEFLKWCEVHHPDYAEVVNRTPLLSKYKRNQVFAREISMSYVDQKIHHQIDGEWEEDECP